MSCSTKMQLSAASGAASDGEGVCAQAVIEIQRRLPNARVLYVSATGATESSNLGYMQRLGLWGPGTAFASRQSFVSLLTTRGVGEPLPPISPIRCCGAPKLEPVQKMMPT